MFENAKDLLLEEIRRLEEQLADLICRLQQEGWVDTNWYLDDAIIFETKMKLYRGLITAIDEGRMPTREALDAYQQRLAYKVFSWPRRQSTNEIDNAIDRFQREAHRNAYVFIQNRVLEAPSVFST